jgi:hypothetical protein
MTGVHPDIGPELRRLAQTILDQIDPAVRLAAARAMGDGAGTGKCQQVWCPVCALAAVVTGEEHPLLTVIADHSATPPDGPPGGGEGVETADEAVPPSRYQPITVTVDE